MKSLTIPALALSVAALAACGAGPQRPADQTELTQADPQRPADLTDLTVADAAVLVRKGRVTSTELTEAYLRRAEAGANLNAFITLDRTRALAAASQADADRAAGKVRGRLHGVPIVVKDNTQVAGMPNTAGTPALRNFVPQTSAPVAQRLIDAGAIVLGKTNMHELAFGISGYNEAFKTGAEYGVRNPYDPTRFAGGSSSGTGAAIGARMAPGGLGTDTGGSVRLPAAVNGIAGLRPTQGRYSQEGIAPISHTRDTAGPMARTVADVALLDAVITGATAVKAASLKGVRLGVARKPFFANLDADTQAVTDAVLGKLKAAGVELVELDMSALGKLNEAVSFPVAMYEAYDDMVAYLKASGSGVSIEQLAAGIASKDVKDTYSQLVLPRKLPGPDGLVDGKPVYDAAMAQGRPALKKYYAEAFAKNRIDALLFPTTPMVSAPQGPQASSLENFQRFIQNTDPGSNVGIPGLSIPAGLGPTTGLPVGVELDGPAGSDERLLALGIAIETLLGPTPAPRR